MQRASPSQPGHSRRLRARLALQQPALVVAGSVVERGQRLAGGARVGQWPGGGRAYLWRAPCRPPHQCAVPPLYTAPTITASTPRTAIQHPTNQQAISPAPNNHQSNEPHSQSNPARFRGAAQRRPATYHRCEAGRAGRGGGGLWRAPRAGGGARAAAARRWPIRAAPKPSGSLPLLPWLPRSPPHRQQVPVRSSVTTLAGTSAAIAACGWRQHLAGGGRRAAEVRCSNASALA